MAKETAKSGLGSGTIEPQLAIFPVTQLQMAELLKRYFNSPTEVVKGMHHGFPAATPLEIGTILIDPNVFPALDKPSFMSAMETGGYTVNDSQTVANTLFPPTTTVRTVVVQGNQSWQNIGVSVGPGQTATIRYKSGSWYVSPGIGYCGPEGSYSYYAKSGYALPGYREGGLVARVGGQAFWVGTQASVPNGRYGAIELVMNDDINSYYGLGIRDNAGALTVEITVTG